MFGGWASRVHWRLVVVLILVTDDIAAADDAVILVIVDGGYWIYSTNTHVGLAFITYEAVASHEILFANLWRKLSNISVVRYDG